MGYLYKNMNAKITIGNVVVYHVKSVLIEQSIKALADSAKIRMPRNTKLSVNNRVRNTEDYNIRNFIKEGDPVTIQLGYDDNLETEFQGYVETIGAAIPLELECVDEMYKLQQTSYTRTFNSVTLLQLLEFIAPGYSYQLIDNINLGKFVINNSSAYKVLQALKKDYLLHAYFTGKTLNVGFATDLSGEVKHNYHLTRNVRADTNLNYVSNSDKKIKIKAISTDNEGNKIIVEHGDDNGSVRTMNYANKTRNELQNLAKKQYENTSFDGFEGKISAWGEPRTRAGDTIRIIDGFISDSDRTGNYIAESVKIKFNKSAGLKRTINPTIKLS